LFFFLYSGHGERFDEFKPSLVNQSPANLVLWYYVFK